MICQATVNDLVYGVDITSIQHTKAYVCGFLFQHRVEGQAPWVALIKKKRPTWQRGKLNGIGGSIEVGETPMEAMVREFQEETGAVVMSWRCYAMLRHGTALVYMFMAMSPDVVIRSTTDEDVDFYSQSVCFTQMAISNLRWLVPLALSKNQEVAMIADDAPLPEPLQ